MKSLRVGFSVVAGVALAILVFALRTAAAQNRVASITPECAFPGDQVTLTGFGFGALNVRVTVADQPAQIVRAAGTTVTFIVPGGAPYGRTTVRITHKQGSQTGSIDFRVGCPPREGVLLDGYPQAPARAAVVDLMGSPVDGSQVQDGEILTRLDVFLAPDATVEQVNALLRRATGGIVTMYHGLPAFTISIPRAVSIQALQALADSFGRARGAAHVSIGRLATPDVMPPADGGDPTLSQLRTFCPTRFPAAWNAHRLAQDASRGAPVIILVQDYFQIPPDADYVNFHPREIPTFSLDSHTLESDEHGYDVITTMAAKFDNSNPTGANPFPDRLDIRGISATHLTYLQFQLHTINAFPPFGPFLVQSSQGLMNLCLPDEACPSPAVRTGYLVDLTYGAAVWRYLTQPRWPDFIVTSSAGNKRNKHVAEIYNGAGASTFNSPINAATQSDILLPLIQASTLWDPAPPFAASGYPRLTVTDPTTLAQLTAFRTSLGPQQNEDNALIVGATTSDFDFKRLAEADFSNSLPDVRAVGEKVYTLDQGLTMGTSVAAPQVAGLASYLWLLSPELRYHQPAQVTRRAIVDNARDAPHAGKVIDAYASVLSLDEAVLPTPATAPIRLEILDTNGKGGFTQDDLQEFRFVLLDDAGLPVPAPSRRDHSRWDLNGDGFTGGPGTERFDLDRVNSVRFGQSLYGNVGTEILGTPWPFDENKLTDLDILLYYAYSDLYTGRAAARDSMLGCYLASIGIVPPRPMDSASDQCLDIAVEVTPTEVALAPGDTVRFVATVTGTSNTAVKWSVPAGGGTITADGLFQAFTFEGGTFPVRATSLADSTKFGQAVVKIQGFDHISSEVVATTEARISQQMGCFSDNRAQIRTLHCIDCSETTSVALRSNSVRCIATNRFTAGQVAVSGVYTYDISRDLCPVIPGINNFARCNFLHDYFMSLADSTAVHYAWTFVLPPKVNHLQRFQVSRLGAIILDVASGQEGDLVLGPGRYRVDASLQIAAAGEPDSTQTLAFSGFEQLSLTGLPAPVPPGPQGVVAEASPTMVYARRRTAEGPLGLVATPNPVTAGARSVVFEIPESVRGSRVELSVFDLTGRRVRSLVSDVTSAGRRTIEWDLRDQDGRAVPGGLFFCRLRADGQESTRKIMVLTR